MTYTLLLLLVLAWPVAFIAGCCKAGDMSSACKAEAIAVNCLTQLAPRVLDAVTSALSSGDWATAMETLGVKYGFDAVLCAVQAVEASTAGAVRDRARQYRAARKSRP